MTNRRQVKSEGWRKPRQWNSFYATDKFVAWKNGHENFGCSR